MARDAGKAFLLFIDSRFDLVQFVARAPQKKKTGSTARRGPRQQSQFIEDEGRRQPEQQRGTGGPAATEQRPQTPQERELAQRNGCRFSVGRKSEVSP